MATQVQFRRGTTSQNNAFTGALGEITFDTQVKTFRVHDGSTAGGGAILVNTAVAQTLTNKTHSTNSVWNGTPIALLYGGTGSALTAVAGAVPYSTSSALALTAAGTAGQVLVSGGVNSPTWVNQSAITAGSTASATIATNIAGGSAGQLVIQSDTNLTTFITAGAAGTFLQSTGASTAPTFAAGNITIGSTTTALGATSTSLVGLTAIDATVGATSFFAAPTSPALFSSGTSISIGATTGTTTIRNAIVAITNAVTIGSTLDLGHASDTTLARSSAGVVNIEGDDIVTLARSQTLTNKTLTFPIIDNYRKGFSNIATAAGTTTLTVTSNNYQRFTGVTTQTIVLPVTSTLAAGVSYEIENASTGNLTVNSSGGNLVITIIPGVTVQCMCIGTTLTTSADWDAEYNEFATITGTGAVVLATSPTLVTPVIGAATGTSVILSSGAQSASLGVGTAASGTTGEIRATNQITSFYSDDRLKTRTGNIENALQKVLSLDGFHYHANETAVALGYDADKLEVGLSAQQVQAVLPEVIAPAPIDPQYMTMHYERLVPLLVEAIKEQQKQISDLNDKVAHLTRTGA